MFQHDNKKNSIRMGFFLLLNSLYFLFESCTKAMKMLYSSTNIRTLERIPTSYLNLLIQLYRVYCIVHGHIKLEKGRANQL
jgi:hypothetical protein